jgi:hypothetical protein
VEPEAYSTRIIDFFQEALLPPASAHVE